MFGRTQVETLCKLDIVEYAGSYRTVQNKAVIKVEMRKCVERACTAAGIRWSDCELQGEGDDILILAPGTVPRGAFVGEFPRALVVELCSHNEGRVLGEQIKLRLALCVGQVDRGPAGTVGNGIDYVERLLGARVFKKTLAKSSGPLGMIVSEHFYMEVVRYSSEYEPDAYRRISFKVKETGGTAWIRLPGHQLPNTSFPKLRDMLGRWGGGFSL
jgi:hypothetical protein